MFKQYKNKTSDRKQYSRIVQGGDFERRGSKIGFWDRRTDIEKNQDTDVIIFTLPLQYNKRPHLLAYDFYGRSDLMWLILQYNNIVDIDEEFITGKEIRVPPYNRVFSDIITKNINYSNV
jgi:hypothetical protein